VDLPLVRSLKFRPPVGERPPEPPAGGPELGPYPLGKLRGLGCAGLAALATDEIRPPEEPTSIAVSCQTVSFVLCSRPPKKRSEPWASETQSALCGWVGSKLARSIPPAQDRIETDWRVVDVDPVDLIFARARVNLISGE
jgi:hypothetical protein